MQKEVLMQTLWGELKLWKNSLPEVSFLHEPVPPIQHHIVQLHPVHGALVTELTGAVPDRGVVLHGVVSVKPPPAHRSD